MSITVFVLLGYLSGSVLYARIFVGIFKGVDVFGESRDQNPGTFNAFKYVGFRCGVLTLIFDILKGFVPVILYIAYSGYRNLPVSGLAFVMAAPVIGHTFPLFYRFRGGKGIAVTFGCLLGVLPIWQPFVFFAAFFIIYSTVLQITPHFYRTLAAYFSTSLCLAWESVSFTIWIGFAIITVAVCIRMFASPEEKERMEVRFLWTH